jgi:hypothetical protein
LVQAPLFKRSHGRVVGIATSYSLEDRGVRVRVPVESRIFSISTTLVLGPTQLPIPWKPGMKRLGREDDHSPPTIKSLIFITLHFSNLSQMVNYFIYMRYLEGTTNCRVRRRFVCYVVTLDYEIASTTCFDLTHKRNTSTVTKHDKKLGLQVKVLTFASLVHWPPVSVCAQRMWQTALRAVAWPNGSHDRHAHIHIHTHTHTHCYSKPCKQEALAESTQHT